MFAVFRCCSWLALALNLFKEQEAAEEDGL